MLNIKVIFYIGIKIMKWNKKYVIIVYNRVGQIMDHIIVAAAPISLWKQKFINNDLSYNNDWNFCWLLISLYLSVRLTNIFILATPDI